MRKSIVLLTLAVLALGGWNVKLSREIAQAQAVTRIVIANMSEETDLSNIESQLQDLDWRTEEVEAAVINSGLEYHDLTNLENRVELLEDRRSVTGFNSPRLEDSLLGR